MSSSKIIKKQAQRVRIRDDFGEIVSYTYDNDNMLASLTRGASTIQFTYNANGNLLSRTDRRGNVTQFNYDENNRLVLDICKKTGFRWRWAMSEVEAVIPDEVKIVGFARSQAGYVINVESNEAVYVSKAMIAIEGLHDLGSPELVDYSRHETPTFSLY